MAKTATILWPWPTTRELGGALDPFTEIQEMEVSLSVAPAAPFTVLGSVVPVVNEATASFSQTELGTGDYIYRLVCIDKLGQRSVDSDWPFLAADESPPSAPVNVTITLT